MTQSAPGPAAALLAAPFRLFFLLAAVHAAGAMAAWIGQLTGSLALPLAWAGPSWHAHELLFGTLPAALAGFLLTAMANWTGTAPLSGRPLAALAALWAAGRLGLWFSAGALPVLVALVDMAFPLTLGIYATTVLVRQGHHRSLLLMAAVAALAAASLSSHLGNTGVVPGAAGYAQELALSAALTLMVIIGGRITPAFTNNWLQRQGRPRAAQARPALERLVLGSTLALLAASLLALPEPWVAPLALLAAAANGARLAGWSGWQARSEPLLWILHLGYGWIVLAMALRGAAPMLDGLSASAWLHATGAGAMGTLILAVATRVALGHTGRTLALSSGGLAIYLLILGAGLVRTAVAVLPGAPYREGLMLAAGGWIGAFLLYALLYGPILARPRPDGRPG